MPFQTRPILTNHKSVSR